MLKQFLRAQGNSDISVTHLLPTNEMDFELLKLRIWGLSCFIYFFFFHLKDIKQTEVNCAVLLNS